MKRHVTRREFIKAVGSGAAALSLQRCRSRTPERKPNIVLIVADDFGWKDAGFQGSSVYRTPCLDGLAREGIIFTDAYSNGPNCAPSRASLLTGQYTPRHGIYTVGSAERGASRRRKLIPVENRTILDPEAVTLADALNSAGYACASIGKWHLGDDPEAGPEAHGFDLNIGGGLVGHPPQGYFPPFGLPSMKDEPGGRYLTDVLTDEAVTFIESAKDGPFFLYLSHYAVHTPHQAPEELVEKYRGGDRGLFPGNPVYAAMVEGLDRSVGRIAETLAKLGLEKDTLLIFFSDNGGLRRVTSAEPLRGGKGMLYEGGIRVPLVFRWPGRIEAGGRFSLPVMGADLFPTIAEAAGVSSPPEHACDGVSLVKAALLGRSFERDALFWHFPAYLEGKAEGARDPHFRTRPASAVRAGEWKLIEYFEDGALELYNLREDIGEARNLAGIFPERARELHSRLKDWQQSLGAFIPGETNPDYSGDPIIRSAGTPRD